MLFAAVSAFGPKRT